MVKFIGEAICLCQHETCLLSAREAKAQEAETLAEETLNQALDAGAMDAAGLNQFRQGPCRAVIGENEGTSVIT